MPLTPLLGTWKGSGTGEYPTISPFSYTEELQITASGKPFLNYRQLTWSSAGAALHTEVGFLRAPREDAIEFIIAQPTGQTELLEGQFTAIGESGFELELTGKIMNSTTAKRVEATRRVWRFEGDQLTYKFAMAAVGIPLTHHLSARLLRVEPA